MKCVVAVTMPAADLHLERQLQGMIRPVDVERPCPPSDPASPSSVLERPFDCGWMKEDSRITIALQHFVLHAFVAGRVSTLAGGRVHQNLSFGHSRFGVEKKLTALQLERAMDRVQAGAKLPVNFGLRRIEQDLQALILRLCQWALMMTDNAAMMLAMRIFLNVPRLLMPGKPQNRTAGASRSRKSPRDRSPR